MRFIKTGGLAAVLLCGISTKMYGQESCPTPTQTVNIGTAAVGGAECAPLPVGVNGYFMLRFPVGCSVDPDNDIVFDVNWGDGTTITDLPPTQVMSGGTSSTGAIFYYYFSQAPPFPADPNFTHTYPTQIITCHFDITVYIKVKSTGAIVHQLRTPVAVYHQTDDYDGARPLVVVEQTTGQNIFLVCVGQEACIRFKDISELNCNPAEPQPGFDKNVAARHIQYEYGTGDQGNQIPGIRVAGAPYTNASGGKTSGTRFDGGNGFNNGTYRTINNPGVSTDALSNEICVPNTTTMADVGKEFEVKLYNWNKCNPGAPDRSVAISTTARIRIVASPPAPEPWSQSFCNRTGNTYSNAQYTASLTHNPGTMTPGRYYYFRDNGSGTGPSTTDLSQAIHEVYNNKSSFNPVTLFNSSSQDYLNPAVAQTKVYWVVYEFNNSQDAYNVLCTSPPAKITYTIREDISAQPGIPTRNPNKTNVCPDETVRFTVNGNDGSLTRTYGGEIEYVWESGTGYTVVATEPNNGRWADIKFTADPAAGSNQTVTMNLYRKWKTAADIKPSQCAAGKDCDYCASAMRPFTIIVDSKPAATISGGGTICAGEQLALTINGFRGAPGTTSYDIVLDPNGETRTGITATGSVTINANPADGTVTTYKIRTITSKPNGCVNSPTSTTVINKREALTLTGPVGGPSPVCAGSSNQYSLPVPPNNNPSGSKTVGGATQYVWSYNGSNYPGTSATSASIPAGTAIDNTQSAFRDVEVVWRYTTDAAQSSGDKRCPSPKITKTIEIRPAPTVKINAGTPNRTVCPGSGTTIDIDVTGTPGVDWVVNWRVDASVQASATIPGTTSGTATFTVNIANSPYLTATGTHTFELMSVSQAAAGGCAGVVSTPKTASIKVLKQPTATISGTISVCEGTPVDIPITLTGENTGTYRVDYTVNGSPQSVNFTVPLSSPELQIPVSQINQGSLATTTVIVTRVTEQTTGLNGAAISCDNTASSQYVITNHQYPEQADAGPDDEVCETTTPPYTRTLAGNQPTSPNTGMWSIVTGPAGGGTFADATLYTTAFTSTVNGRYELKWTIYASGVCLPSTDNVILDFGKPPHTAYAGAPDKWCYDLSSPAAFQLAANAPDLTTEAGKWRAKPGNPGTATFSDPTDNQSKVTVSAYGSYTFIWKLYNTCDSTMSEVTINFVETPELVPILDQEWCPEVPSEMPVFASATSIPNVTYSWAFVGASMPGFPASGTGQFPNGNTPANNTVYNVTYRVRVTVDNQGCNTSRDVNISLKPRPQLDAVSPASMCHGSTVTFQLNPYMAQPVTYNWNNDDTSIGLPATGPVTETTPPYRYQFTAQNMTTEPVTANVTNLTATVNGCTSLPMNVALTVSPMPTLTPPVPEICPEEEVTAAQTTVTSNITNTGTTYVWSYAGPYIGFNVPSPATNDNVGPFTAITNEGSAPVGGTVTVTGTANGCSSTIQYNIVVKPRPVVRAVPDQSLCPTPAGAAAGAAGGTFAPITFASTNLSSDVTYTWEKIPPAGATVNGSANPVPAAELTFGDNTAGSVETYHWSVVGMGDAASPAKGCQSRPVTFNLNVNPRPVTILNPGNQTVCSGDAFQNITFYDNAGGISTFGWTITDPNNITGAVILSGSSNPITFPNVTNNTNSSPYPPATFSVTATSLFGCTGPPATGSLTVSQAPVISPPSPIDACSDALVTPAPFTTSNGVTSTDYTWSISDPAIAQNLPAGATVTSTMDPFTTTVNNTTTAMQATVTVTARLNTCLSAPVSFPVTVRPVPKVNAVSGQTVCPGDGVTIPQFSTNLTGNDASVVSWTLNNPGISAPPLAASGSNNIAPFTAAPNLSGTPLTGTFALTANMTYGALVCSGPSTSFTVTVNPTPNVTQQPDLEYCNGDMVPPIVFTSVSGVVTYSWTQTPAGGLGIGLANLSGNGNLPGFTAVNNTIQLLEAGESVFTVTSNAEGCPSVPMNFKITVKPVPQLDVYPNVNVCGGTTITPPAFSLNPNITYPGATTYEWQVIDGWIPESDLPDTPQTGNMPVFTPDTTRAGYVAPASNPLWGETPTMMTVKVTPTHAFCPGSSKDVYIQLNPLPETTIGTNEGNCVANSGLKLYFADDSHGTPGSQYIWTIENPNPAPPADQPVFEDPSNMGAYTVVRYPADALTWSGTLSVIERNTFRCEGPKVSMPIQVIAQPVVDAGRDREVCYGDTVILNGKLIKGGTYHVEYSWDPQTDLIADRDTRNPVSKPESTIPYRFYATEGDPTVGFCKSEPSIVTVTVLQSPLAPMVPARVYCESDKLMKMSTVNATDVMYWERLQESSPGVWTPVPGAITNSTDSTTLSMNLPTVHPDALPSYPIAWPSVTSQDTVIRYQVYQTRVVGALTCKSPTAETRLTINRSPAAPAVDPLGYCLNENYPLYTLSATSGENIIWYNNDRTTVTGYGKDIDVYLPGAVSVESSSGPPPAYTPFTTYYATTTSGHGCSSDFTPMPLIIYPNPTLDFALTDAGGNPTTGGCSPFELNAANTSADVNNYYTWKWWSVVDSDTVQAPIGATVQHVYTLPVNANYVQTPWVQLIGKSRYNKDSKTGAYCSSIKEQMLTISPGVIADFVVSDTVGCSGLQVFFNSTSTGAINSRWYWDEPAPPPWSQGSAQPPSNTPGPWYGIQGANPYHGFDNTIQAGPKRYHVWLQVDNNYCADSKDTIISAYSVPGASFDHNVPNSGLCPPDSVMFTNTSSGIANSTATLYAWNFADGSVDTAAFKSPVYHRYESWNQSSPKQYRIDLTAFNRYTLSNNTVLTCSNVFEKYFLVNPQIQAGFTGDSTGCAPAIARLQTQSIGSISSYQWNWGDGEPLSSGSNPFHTYKEVPPTNVEKVYRITLTARNSWCSDTVSRPFYLYPTPVAGFAVDKTSGCQPLTVTFTNTSNSTAYPNPATGMTYTYEYGDGYADNLTTTDPVTHTFTNTLGTNLPMSPMLTAKNDYGCAGTFSLGITVLPYVRADFTMEDTVGCSGKFTTKFYNTSQGYNTYQYTFGDGAVASGTRTSGVRTEHTYINRSMYRDTVYTVTLTVNAGQQCPDAITKQVKVLSQPVADFRPGSPYPADFPYPVAPIQIDNLVGLPDRDYLKYLWSLTEQVPLGQPLGQPNHFSTSEYPSPLRISDWGSFDITQRVTAPNNICIDSKTLTINIVPPAPYANFEEVPPACMPYEVAFVNTSRYGKAYSWDFGDGNASSDFEPKHVFTDAGTYKVTLTVTGDNMFPSVKEQYVTVHPLPQTDFKTQPNFLWVGQALRAFNYTAHQFSNGTPYDVWYRWDWGDNTPKDTVESPSHMYLKAGTYSITLTVGTYTNPQCITTLTKANAVDLENAGDIILPNTFKPSASGEPSDEIQERGYKNYLFYPPVLSPTRKYRLMIFNRWGQLLFETTSPTRGWNGYFKGRLCDEGVYIYKIEGVFETGQSFSKMGDITLLR
jgi:PKD repeat protein